MDTADLTAAIIGVFLLIILSGFFSSSETALTVVSKGKLFSLKQQGNKRAKRLLELRKRKEDLISSILLGNNIVNILATSLATGVAITLFDDAGIVYATLLMTALIFVFGEVFPKTLALKRSFQMALFVTPFMSIYIRLVSPVTRVIGHMVKGMIWLVYMVQKKEVESTEADELRGMIVMQHQEGKMSKRNKDMLGSILDLSVREISEVMLHRKSVKTINADLSAPEIINQALQMPHTRIPLWKKNPDNIIGVLNTKRLLKLMYKDPKKIDKRGIMDTVYKPWFVPETTDLQAQLQAFLSKRYHLALVVDEYGVFQGIVTMEDLLEEIVGDIDDEQDVVGEDIKQLSKKQWLIAGTVTIRDINRTLEWDLPDEEAATLAGLVMHEAESIPEIGEGVVSYGRRFTVMAKNDHQLTQIRVELLK